MADDDESRRRQEINMFAAMALGGSDDAMTAKPSNTLVARGTAGGSVLHQISETVQYDSSTFNPLPPPSAVTTTTTPTNGSTVGTSSTSGSFDFLAVAGADLTSGSFSMASRSEDRKPPAGENSNLAAAAAALSGPDGPASSTPAPPKISLADKRKTSKEKCPLRITEDQELPMFAEEVILHRPLFFGPILPPRVLHEARDMVRNAVDDYRLRHPEDPNPPRLQQLPPAVRNVVGAIRTFGYGLDVLDADASFERKEEYWRGSDCVSTFQPVWGHDLRAERVKEYRKQKPPNIQRPSIISRLSTAPASFATNDTGGFLKALRGKTGTVPEEEEDSLEETGATALDSDNNQFSNWLKADEDHSAILSGGGGESIGSLRSSESLVAETALEARKEISEPPTEQQIFSQWAMGSATGTFQAAASQPPQIPSEQEIFMQWARGTEATISMDSSLNERSESAFSQVTFQRAPSARRADSDDDSVKEDEQKRQVGLNDHLSKAVASLTEDGPQTSPDLLIESANVLLSQVPQDGSLARPLTNYELTGGFAPVFGADDAPLPESADLGIHETKEEQARTNDAKRSQEIIGRFVLPNIFGTVACPRVTGPSDTHSWNSRTASYRRTVPLSTGTPSVMSEQASLTSQSRKRAAADEMSNLTGTKSSQGQPTRKKEVKSKKRPITRSRHGWWNVQGEATNGQGETETVSPLHLPPSPHVPSSTIESGRYPFVTVLDPSPEKLRKSNLPLSHLHSATSLEQSLVFLSDRPPGHRYLQIDTQAIGFPPIKGEVEPLFCSLAIYNVETISSSPGGEQGPSPIPDLHCCGRVTEILYFDVIGDKTVAERCQGALWPYLSESSELSHNLRSTRCGVFPLPSNLSVANLYAVLIVRKVLADDSEVEPYLKTGKNIVDIEKLRSNAERASSKNGKFLMPFAFGVAPLLQVFGTENPSYATSRAVQIPLFRFQGDEREIIDHIMVMLYPRADHKASGISGPAAVTNGGTAMLVMRNFGYLGIHLAVDSKSSLARERLVDFTGELQIRRKDGACVPSIESSVQVNGYSIVTPRWQPDFVTEPTNNGGRFTAENEDPAGLRSYAQELAPLSLMCAPPSRLTNPTQKSRLHGNDVEPFYHTAFCNQLLCQPRIMHNCLKRRVVIKMEIRDIEWNDDVQGYFAHHPPCGPVIHNCRRGPFLVQHAFSTVSFRGRGGQHHFIDEFKLKLPLDVKPKLRDGKSRTLSLLFTVYSIKVGSKSRWKMTKGFLPGMSSDSGSDTLVDGVGNCEVSRISCGFLPVSGPSCLIDNGLHDVIMKYSVRLPSADLVDQYKLPDGTLLLCEKKRNTDCVAPMSKDDSYAEETFSFESASERHIERSEKSDVGSTVDESCGILGKGQASSEPLSLSVKIFVHSSLHAQNEILDEFLSEEPDLPNISTPRNSTFLSTIRLNRASLARKATAIEMRKADALEDHLVQTTLSLSDHSACSIPRSSPFLLRTLSILWRQFVCGNGDHDILWANPASPISLRMHSFASILHLMGGACLFLSKNGVKEIDGCRTWSVASLGKIVSLVFDEEKLFGPQAVEDIDSDHWANLRAANASPVSQKVPKKGRHIRSNLELFNEVHAGDDMNDREIISSVAGELVGPKRQSTTTLPNRSAGDGKIVIAGEGETADPSSIQALSKNSGIKIDTKTDFQSALRATFNSPDEYSRVRQDPSNVAEKTANDGVTDVSSRRWATMPAVPPGGLASITEAQESEDYEDSDDAVEESFGSFPTNLTSLPEDRPATINPVDEHSAIQKQKKGVKQMRIPKKRQNDERANEKGEDSDQGQRPDSIVPSVPKSDDELENAGLPFLDVIGKSLGLSGVSSDISDERRNVGSSHHRKTRSRSSIDWTLIEVDRDPAITNVGSMNSKALSRHDDSKMWAHRREEASSIELPSFVDRLAAMGKSSKCHARWFPYTYEVIILQWAAILTEQQRLGKQGGSPLVEPDTFTTYESISGTLTRVALRSIGVAVAGAPMLFEVIKKSLGFRLACIFKEVVSRQGDHDTPPLVILDENMLAALDQVISMVTDACIDPRNFDSWELRQTTIDVNDSIILFLRDMFSFIAPKCVYRLILTYFSRFTAKDMNNGQDKDSLIGLRCSWEITKLRLNAVTAFIRFPDLIRVSSPQMLSRSSWWTESATSTTELYFDELLRRYRDLRMTQFADGDSNARLNSMVVGAMRPHWMCELLVDICMTGTEHVEQHIQNRSSSLLHELFWACSQDSIFNGTAVPVASMFVTFIEKILSHVSYIANFPPKCQIRKDLIPCAIFVLQSASPGLLKALWRRLCTSLEGKGELDRYEITMRPRSSNSDRPQADGTANSQRKESSSTDSTPEPDATDMFTLLNLVLRTLEYEGSEENIELENNISDCTETVESWHRDFLLSLPGSREVRSRCHEKSRSADSSYTSSVARRWHAHDGAIVVVNTVHQIVLEMYKILRKSPKGRSFLNPAVNHGSDYGDASIDQPCQLGYLDIVLFVRASTSVYLHALSLQQSDLAITRTLKLSAEIIKVFGISLFLEAVGETLQHWMRMFLIHCGARRATVRIESTDLLELILRCTWECFGSFFRVRVPLLAVQTEVMERLVAIAAARYYREQRRMGLLVEPFSNIYAEASLVPLWRTFDRIETQPASQNVGFRGALIRMAGKLKTLHRAYVAARVLSFIHGSQGNQKDNPGARDFNAESRLRATRINIMRVINASGGHSKQFLGVQGMRQHETQLAHYEAVEDALMDAADVFSPTQLPEHRVAWLLMLADFHASRRKYAEEATCHFYVHVTLSQAAMLHGSLWSNTPFLPWTDNIPDPVYIDGDNPAGDPEYQSDQEYEDDSRYGQGLDNRSSFRRIFYRVANSVGVGNPDWEATGTKTLFSGVAFTADYHTVSPWISLKEMEEDMVEEAEAAGELFLRAGIVENSRLAWSLASHFYSEKFNYAKLVLTYNNLARAIVSQVPPLDPSLPQEVSATLGRFYRVWFHGGAPDELNGIEFVYRAEGSVSLEEFGHHMKSVIKSIVTENTPIHLLLDGQVEERIEDGPAGLAGFSRLGPAPLAPVKIKVTPLRPLFGNNGKLRGLPEWFYRYVDEAFSGYSHVTRHDAHPGGHAPRRRNSLAAKTGVDPHHREHNRSSSASVFSSAETTSANHGRRQSALGQVDRGFRFAAAKEGSLTGVDRFCFVQPKDRSKTSKDWWKTSDGNYAEKRLKVTQLQVAQSFPACVARQTVIHRLVYSVSPLEAGIDSLCQWCSLLFRTAVATVGMSVLGSNPDPGIGTDAAKVVADSIHSSHVKDMGLSLLEKCPEHQEGETDEFALISFDRLSSDEYEKLQVKFARLIVVFLELLHVLIARNRDILLEVIHERKKCAEGQSNRGSGPTGRHGHGRPESIGGLSVDSSKFGTGDPGTLKGQAKEHVSNAKHGTSENPNKHRTTDSNSGKFGSSSSIVRENSRKTTAGKMSTAHRRVVTTGGLKLDSEPGKRTQVEEQLGLNSSLPSNIVGGGLRTDSAIAVQSELQRAFTNLARTLHQRLQAVLETETPRWLKQCSQENYFSMGYYRQTRISIVEELCMTASELPSQNLRSSVDNDGYDSPRGSVAGGSSHSIVSRSSERYGLGQF